MRYYGFILLLALAACQERGPVQETYTLVVPEDNWEMAATLFPGDTIEVSEQSTYQRGDIVVYLDHLPDTSKLRILRVIGVPGDKLELKEGVVSLNDQLFQEPPSIKQPYILYSELIDSAYVASLSREPFDHLFTESWTVRLTEEKAALVKNDWRKIHIASMITALYIGIEVVGRTKENHWTRHTMGPLQIPELGTKVLLDSANADLLQHAGYEWRHKNVVDTALYFVMGDNRDHTHDSRYHGLIPRWAFFGKVIDVRPAKSGGQL